MAKETLTTGPESMLLDRLFGDIASLRGEELDLLYHAATSGEDPAGEIKELASRVMSKYEARNRPVPEHVKLCRRDTTGVTNDAPTALSRVILSLPPVASAPGPLLLSFRLREDIADTDKSSIGELVEELAKDDEETSLSPAAQLADLLLDRFKITGKPDLEALCRLLGLRVREKPFKGFDGVLLRRENATKGIIGINTAIKEISRKRFTVAHEIAHFVIPYHQKPETMCETRLIESFSGELNPAEVEANEFATELLLPGKLVRKRFDLDRPSLARISLVANEFETGLSAATSRFLALTRQPCALVWSMAGRAVWYRTSNELPLPLPIQDLPAAGSVAGKLFVGKRVASGMQQVDPQMWFYSDHAARIKTAFEDSMYFPAYGAVITLLWVTTEKSLSMDSHQPDGHQL
jgi:IrrE N-terminal-like domain